MEIDMNPRTQGKVHPEQGPLEYFLGNFDLDFARNKIPWKTKRIGKIAYTEDGTPYSSMMLIKLKPVPVFVNRSEFHVYRNEMIWGKNRVDTYA